MSNFVKTDEGQDFVLGMQALKRIGQPDDVGSVVAFLASARRALDHRRHHPRRRRLKALSFNESDMDGRLRRFSDVRCLGA